MNHCSFNLLSRLIWSNVKVIFYVTAWLLLMGLIAFKIFDIEELLYLNADAVIIKYTVTQTLLYIGIFVLTITGTNSLYLILLDIKNYITYKHRLDDPKVRTNLLIESINTNQQHFYYLKELRPGYFRLAYRIRKFSNNSHTVIDGTIIVIKKHLTHFISSSSNQALKVSSLCTYNKKCLELCNIKYINLVKSQLYH